MKIKKAFAVVATSALLTAGIGTSAFAATTTPVMPAPVTANAAINLRVMLDNLLGEHAVLVLLSMEKSYSGAPDFMEVANQLNGNTIALSTAIGSVYGNSAGLAFQKLWALHIDYFMNYALATKDHNASGQKQALHDLSQYRFQFAQFLASANPYLKASVLAYGLQTHVGEVIKAFNDYVGKDYVGSEAEFNMAYMHMFMMGDTLSTAIVKQFPKTFGTVSPMTPAADLRVALDELLGEHAVLALMAMEKGYHGSPDFAAVAGQLNQNTKDLAAAIASVYGAPAGAAFQTLWSGHIRDFVSYVVATAKGNATAKAAALSALEQYKQDFSRFLASANPNFFQANALAEGLQVHITELLTTFNDYVAKNYGAAATEFVKSYNHMFMTGTGLATGIVAEFPAKFAVSTDTYPWVMTDFYIKGKDTVNPMSILGIDPQTHQQMWYVPIWYVMHVWKAMGVKSSWNGTTWTIMSPGKVTYTSAGMTSAQGAYAIDINGKMVASVEGAKTWDPYSHVMTTFMPVSTVMQVTKDLGVMSTWSGTNWWIQ